MTIKEQIEKQKQQINANRHSSHRALVQEARKIIPEIAVRMKNIAISYAARDYNIVERGFFKKRKYVRVGLSNTDLNPYQNRLLYDSPEIYVELKSAIISKGFENVSVVKDSTTDKVYINAWLDIT